MIRSRWPKLFLNLLRKKFSFFFSDNCFESFSPNMISFFGKITAAATTGQLTVLFLLHQCRQSIGDLVRTLVSFQSKTFLHIFLDRCLFFNRRLKETSDCCTPLRGSFLNDSECRIIYSLYAFQSFFDALDGFSHRFLLHFFATIQVYRPRFSLTDIMHD